MVAEFAANNSNHGRTVRDERSESFFPSAISDSESGSFSWIWNGTNPISPISISSIFPANDSDSQSYDSSGFNETSPEFSHNSNSIMSFFPPAWSPTDSPENYEIIIRNPSITITSSFSHFFPLPNVPATSFSIPLIFPPTMSETETDDSCSESNQSPRAQFFDSIVSLFPPAGSQTDSSSSKNYEIILPNNPSISTRPKSSNSSKSNRTPPKFSHSILSFFSLAKQLTNTSKPRHTILQKEFPFEMLYKATTNFSDDHKIGTGSFFSVYHATLDDGREVAIKWENSAHACEIDLKVLSHLSHKNLVCFLGFCDSIQHRICVYQYMKNGSLHDHLHKLRSSPLLSSWATRIKVALDAAKGIEYLHMHAETPIIHRNIKSSNILLDAMWTAKVSDFCHFLMPPAVDEIEYMSVLEKMGALAYMDPKYAYNLTVQLTTETDVYSFGIVLLEILSGYMATDINGNEELQSYIAQNKIGRVLDPEVPPPTPFERKVVAHVGSLALDCVSPNGPERPSMTEIVNSLQRALDACVDPDPEECSLND